MRGVLAVLFLLLAFLLSFAGTAWARAVLPDETRVGVSGPDTNTSTCEIDPLSLYKLAKQAAEKAVRTDPEFAEGYYLLGEATRNISGNDAITYFRAAIERDETYALAWQALGRGQAATNNDTIDEAIVALRQAIELCPEDGWAMAYLANALWRIDRDEEADHWYRRAIEVFPKCEEIKRWYAQFRAEL